MTTPEPPPDAAAAAAALFGAGASQAEMLAQILDAMPGQRNGIQVPVPVKSRLPWAEALIRRGVRVHPELMTEFPVPGDHPEAGWMNPPKWGKAERYLEYAATRPDATQANQQIANLLGVIDPAAKARIEAMTDDQKAAELARQQPLMQAMFRDIHAGLIAQQQAEAAKKQDPQPEQGES